MGRKEALGVETVEGWCKPKPGTEDRRARIDQVAGTEAGVEASVQLSLLSWVAEGWKCWSEVTGRETMSFTLRGLGEMQREVFPFRI